MDYQFVCVSQLPLIALWLSAFFNPVNGIVGRDLVLTPKQGLQLNGKSIYYEEESSEILRNQTTRPWERTLKHVTFVTLFTNAAAGAAAGNMSKLKEYDEFLRSPYIPQEVHNDARFGDIATLAAGRMEQVDNGSYNYRFVEGVCDYNCDAARVMALWQVQKIRHRDTNRNYRYEMKFSVSPLRGENAGGTIKRRADESSRSGRNTLQTFIQKDDDYPQSFGRIVYTEDTNFADRRHDDYMERNFRQPLVNEYTATPIPQSTFMHGIYQPYPRIPPPLPPHPGQSGKLNIGEYMQDYQVKATPKIEHFPNVFNLGGAKNPYPTPTTYRPNYQVKFPKPEIYHHQHQPQQQELLKFSENSQEQSAADKLSSPVVTHHFHHHFYMPGSTSSSASAENSINSAEQQLRSPALHSYSNDNREVTTPYFANYYHEHTTRPQTQLQHQHHQQHQQNLPPAPQKLIFPKPQIEQQRLVHVTPVPPLRKPDIYQMYPIHIGRKVPLLIYPAPVEEQSTPRHKPFLHSEQLEEDAIRYSEPDPLYISLTEAQQEGDQSYELLAPQLEAPKRAQYKASKRNEQHVANSLNTKRSQQPDSITAQLPPPDKDQDLRIPYVDDSDEEEEEVDSKQKQDLQHNSSKKDVKISTEKSTANTVKTEATPSVTPITSTTSTTTTTTTTGASTTTVTAAPTTANSHLIATVTADSYSTTNTADTASSREQHATTSASKTLNNFVSTSTTERPLRAASRYRNGYSRSPTSTTEHPVLKWKPKRKAKSAKYVQLQDVKAKSSLRHDENEVTTATTTTTEPPSIANSTVAEAAAPPLIQSAPNIYEVLTQKSVSKSVSIKVGNDGREIPIIIDDNSVPATDDNENEVVKDEEEEGEED